MAIHKECVNYKDGRCTLFGIPVDPDAPACPRFTPRSVAVKSEAPVREYAYIPLGTRWISREFSGGWVGGWRRMWGLRTAWRRRFRHRRGKRKSWHGG